MKLLKLANWLSNGDLERYKQQAQQAQQEQSKLQQMESELTSLNAKLQETQKQLGQTQAQLQINQGFQIELGETQLRLQKVDGEAKLYKKALFEQQKQFNLTQSQLKHTQQALARSQNWLELLKTPIQIVDIQKTLPKQNFDTLWGFGIITPQPQSMSVAGAILVKGWVLGKKSTAKALRVIYQTDILLETPVKHSRPAVMQRYPDIPTANSSGFEFSISVAGIPESAKFKLEALLEDETIVPLCDFLLKSAQIELNDT